MLERVEERTEVDGEEKELRRKNEDGGERYEG